MKMIQLTFALWKKVFDACNEAVAANWQPEYEWEEQEDGNRIKSWSQENCSINAEEFWEEDLFEEEESEEEEEEEDKCSCTSDDDCPCADEKEEKKNKALELKDYTKQMNREAASSLILLLAKEWYKWYRELKPKDKDAELNNGPDDNFGDDIGWVITPYGAEPEFPKVEMSIEFMRFKRRWETVELPKLRHSYIDSRI